MITNVFKKVLAAVVLLTTSLPLIAQSQEPTTLYVMRNQVIIFQAPLAEIDSITFITPEFTIIPVTDVVLNREMITLAVGTSETLIAAIVPANATNQTVVWSSSNPAIASVDDYGVVTAHALGTTIISVVAMDGLHVAQCVVTVGIPVTNITLDRVFATLGVSETLTLTAAVHPADATNNTVVWTSSADSVATVSDTGVVTGISAGTAVISASTEDGVHTAECVMTIVPVPVTNVTLDRTTATLQVGFTLNLTHTIFPAHATNQNVIWTSSNPSVATVNDNGFVIAMSDGRTVITVRTEDGNFTATTAINARSGVSIGGRIWATRNVGTPGTFAPTPESAGMFFQWNRRVGWTATDPMVNSDGGTVWNSTTPAGTTWESANDPCPDGWRVPTQAELQSLNNAGSVWITQNGVQGRLFGTAPNQIFLPAAGWRYTTGSLGSAGTSGFYWSSTQDGSTNAWRLWFGSGSGGMGSWLRALGLSVRCVAD